MAQEGCRSRPWRGVEDGRGLRLDALLRVRWRKKAVDGALPRARGRKGAAIGCPGEVHGPQRAHVRCPREGTTGGPADGAAARDGEKLDLAGGVRCPAAPCPDASKSHGQLPKRPAKLQLAKARRRWCSRIRDPRKGIRIASIQARCLLVLACRRSDASRRCEARSGFRGFSGHWSGAVARGDARCRLLISQVC